MEKYERARKKSRNVAKVEYREERFRVDLDKLKKLLFGGALVIALAASSLTGIMVKGVDSAKDNMDVYNYISQYSSIVSSNTHRTEDNQHFWYDTPAIARELKNNPETFEMELYSVYDRIGYNDSNKLEQLDDIFSYIDGYGDFNDYLIKNGFVDADGNPSRDKYEDYMNKTILSRIIAEEAEEVRKK